MRCAAAASTLVAVLLAGCTPEPETYARGCAARPPGWRGPAEGIGHLRQFSKVSLSTEGALRWNGVALSDVQLGAYMAEVGKLAPEPQILLEIDAGTPCGRVNAVREIMTRAPICEHLCSEGPTGADWSHGTFSYL